MKKISLITLHAVKNYGSVLQTYATQEYFKKHNFDVEVLNYIRPDTLDENLTTTWTSKDTGFKKYIKKLVLLPTVNKWKTVFGDFLNRRINLSEKSYSYGKDFESGIPDADIYCVGSDQVWNSTWNLGFIPELFLSYVPQDKKKVSFSSSFGKTKLDNWEKEKTKKYLKQFNSLSVREESAVQIIEDLGIFGAKHTLDPTLLFDLKFWSEFASDRLVKRKYLLIYQLNSNKDFDEFAKNYAKENDLQLVRLCTRYDQIIKNGKSILIPEVEDFVSLFLNAECIITDSFHATAFSINLNKPFISIYPNDFSTRIESILKQMKLMDRALVDFSSKISMSKIDFEYANTVLNRQREETKKYFENAFIN